ncbi:DUF2474 domain-containing protein [Acinetobacter sp. ASP199]|nr:DUF2474 domain-containing protein [Acinetobacter sp. ASP199]UNT59914.1 DUF2474 family protein [Acinetobacter sp. ASP199]UOH74340.1 DUF2474 domain-containing protein [Acinetobacter schindleri]
MKLNRTGWFIVLWLAGFLTMAIIAGLFRFLLQLAY